MPTIEQRNLAKVNFAEKNARRKAYSPGGGWYREARRARGAVDGAFGRMPASTKVVLAVGTSKATAYAQEAEIERNRVSAKVNKKNNTVLNVEAANKLKVG